MTSDLLSPIWAQPERRPEFSLLHWEAVLGQSRQAGLMGRLARHHIDQGWMAEVPARPRLYLEGALRQVDRLHHELRWEIDCIRRALAPLGVPFVLLKGAAYFAADLPPKRGRLFGDIDIMVRREHLQQVEGALFVPGGSATSATPTTSATTANGCTKFRRCATFSVAP